MSTSVHWRPPPVSTRTIGRTWPTLPGHPRYTVTTVPAHTGRKRKPFAEVAESSYAFEGRFVAVAKSGIALHQGWRVCTRRNRTYSAGQTWRAVREAGHRDRTVEGPQGRGETQTPARRKGAHRQPSQAGSETVARRSSRAGRRGFRRGVPPGPLAPGASERAPARRRESAARRAKSRADQRRRGPP